MNAVPQRLVQHPIQHGGGPPLLAPLLVTMVGGMGLLAAILRREK